MSIRLLALLALLCLVACPEPEPEPDTTFCDDLLETQAACMTEDNLAACESANEECPGQVLVMESCPLQFGCP